MEALEKKLKAANNKLARRDATIRNLKKQLAQKDRVIANMSANGTRSNY